VNYRDKKVVGDNIAFFVPPSGKNPLFGSWNQNVEEEVLFFVTQKSDSLAPGGQA
jgi:hypothetical protein